MADTIHVVPGPKCDPGRVALWERDDAHPGGEVFVAAPHKGEPSAKPVEVAMTPFVNDRLQLGLLATTDKPAGTPPEPPAESQHEPSMPARETRGRG